jgi:hypothetical protein
VDAPSTGLVPRYSALLVMDSIVDDSLSILCTFLSGTTDPYCSRHNPPLLFSPFLSASLPLFLCCPLDFLHITA